MKTSGSSNNRLLAVTLIFAVGAGLFLLNSRNTEHETAPMMEKTAELDRLDTRAEVSAKQETDSSPGNSVTNHHEAEKLNEYASQISVVGINPAATRSRLKLENGILSDYVVGEQVLPDVYIQHIESTQVTFTHQDHVFKIALSGENQWPEDALIAVGGVSADGSVSALPPKDGHQVAPKDGHQVSPIKSNYSLAAAGVSADGSLESQNVSVANEGTASNPAAVRTNGQVGQVDSTYQQPAGVAADGSMMEQGAVN